MESGTAKTVGKEFYKVHANTRERSGPEVGPEKNRLDALEAEKGGRKERRKQRWVLKFPH